jgi:hypothetical protein
MDNKEETDDPGPGKGKHLFYKSPLPGIGVK